jgi:hypothetical protein
VSLYFDYDTGTFEEMEGSKVEAIDKEVIGERYGMEFAEEY